MSVWPAVETFCTIMSTLMPASASVRNTRRRDAGPVGHLLDRDLRLGDVVRDTRDDRLLHRLGSSSVTHVPGAQVKLERTWTFTPWLRANSTERSASTRPPVAAISSISSNETCASLRAVGHDARVGAVHAFDVGVDLAHVGRRARRRARRRSCRSRRGRAS